MKREKYILVTGNLGYIGSLLTENLVRDGFRVCGVDLAHFAYGVIRHPLNVSFEQIYDDYDNLTVEFLEKFDSVVHLAAYSNDPFSGLSDNDLYGGVSRATASIIKKCEKIGNQFIFPSSCSIYGDTPGISDESSVPRPLTGYSRNKVDIERLIMGSNNLRAVVLRFSTLFGLSPRIRFDLVINMLCGMVLTTGKVLLNSNGQAWRPHLHIEDAVATIVNAISLNDLLPQKTVLNVGLHENNLKIIDVAELIANETRSEVGFMTNEADINSLHADKKITDGVDKRNYFVNFDRFRSSPICPSRIRTVQSGIKQLLDDLRAVDLTSAKFQQLDFYRLQYLSHLTKTKQLRI